MLRARLLRAKKRTRIEKKNRVLSEQRYYVSMSHIIANGLPSGSTAIANQPIQGISCLGTVILSPSFSILLLYSSTDSTEMQLSGFSSLCLFPTPPLTPGLSRRVLSYLAERLNHPVFHSRSRPLFYLPSEQIRVELSQFCDIVCRDVKM